MSLFELDSLLIDMEFLANTGHTSMEEFRKCNGYSYYKRKHELPLREGLVELGEDQDVLDMALDACSKESNCEVYPIKREELNKAERIATICERPDSPEVRNNEMADDDFYEEGAEISEEEMEDGYIPVGSRHEYMNIDVEVPVEFDSDFGDSDYLESIHSSDEEERDGSSRVRLRYPEFNSQRDMDNPRFCVGLKYADFKDFKDVVKIWSINNKKPIKFAHSDARRVQVVCKTRHQNGCPWNIWVANTAEKKDVQIRACELKHEGCAPMSFKNKFADFHHIAKRYLERFQADPMWSSASIRKTVQEDLHLEISKWKAWKARRTTMDLIRGKVVDQYCRLHDYYEEFRRSDIGTTILVETSGATFHRMYCCLAACKQGFRDGCRKFVGIDGCFFKGNCYMPLASMGTMDYFRLLMLL
ncbi:hypothetical protein LINPERPRIM_LOCUS30693 [Linum perenne]